MVEESGALHAISHARNDADTGLPLRTLDSTCCRRPFFLSKSRAVILCHTPGASTLPWRRHRLNEKLPSTHSNIAFSFNPNISRKWAAINHPCVSVHSVCHPRSGLIERRLDVQACQIHCWSYHTVIYFPLQCANSSNSQVHFLPDEE